jgi:hypothetical protein
MLAHCVGVGIALKGLCAVAVLGVFLCGPPYLVFPVLLFSPGCLFIVFLFLFFFLSLSLRVPVGFGQSYEGSHMLLQCVGVGMVLCGGSLGVF